MILKSELAGWYNSKCVCKSYCIKCRIGSIPLRGFWNCAGSQQSNSYAGLWSIVSGAGGTVVTSNMYNSVFTGILGNSYTLRWTISNGSCTSSDDVVIYFPVVAAQPDPFTSAPISVCPNTGGYIYTVPVVGGNTYTWNYTGTGATITPIGVGNSVSIAFSPTATSGDLSVSAVNGCGASTPRTVTITVKALPRGCCRSQQIDMCWSKYYSWLQRQWVEAPMPGVQFRQDLVSNCKPVCIACCDNYLYCC